MDNSAVVSALRAHALDQASITALVGERVYVSRSDAVGAFPCIVLELAGGPGYLNQAHYQIDLRVHFWASGSWAECFSVQNAFANVFEGADYTKDGGELPLPMVSVSAEAPIQMPLGDLFHLAQTYHVKAKEA